LTGEELSMIAEDLQTLEKEVQKRKRIASEWAGKMHDLAEEWLPAGYDEIYEIAEGTYNACLAWKQAVDALKAAKKVEG
jgi:hypothetical protein